MTRNKENRNFGIDVARTVAIFGVILVHTTGIGFGRFGVQLFFLISGYLLATFREHENSGAFIARRAIRLFPLYFIMLTLYSINNRLFIDPLNFLLLGNIAWLTPQIPGSWSISTEWIFSIFLVSLGNFTLKRIKIFVMVSFISQILSGFYVWAVGGADSPQNIDRYFFFTWINTTNYLINLSFFLVGIAIRRKYLDITLSTISLIAIFLVCVLIDEVIGHMMFIWNFGIMAIFLLCLRVRTDSLRVRNFFSFIGKRTYGIFFSHFYVISLLGEFNMFSLVPSESLIKLATLFLTCLFSIALGSLTWALIEYPTLKLYSRIKGRKNV